MNKYEYYSPNILEIHSSVSDADPSFRKVTNRIVDFILNKDIAIETGGGELSTKKFRSAIQKEISNLIALKTAGIDPQSEQAHRIRTLSKELIEALLSGTLIRSVHEGDYLGTVALGIELAKNPELINSLTISSGFGGSDQKDINLRLPAYILPGIKIIENLIKTYQNNGLQDFAPTYRVFFAPYAAIRVNGAEMETARILSNLDISYRYLSEYVHHFHPTIAPFITFECEMPWEEHDELTTLTLQYFSLLLENATDKSVVTAREVLKDRGHNNGGKNGSDLSLLYASAHSLFFKDGLNHPGNVFTDKTKPFFALSVGGRPERLFNTMRSHIRNTSEIEGLSQLTSGSNGKLKRWQESVRDARSTYSAVLSDTTFHAVDLPLISIPGITTVGSHPVYYESPYDIGINQVDGSPVEMLQSFRRLIQEDPNLSGQQRSLELDRLKAVEHDIKQLLEDAGGEDQLLEFINGSSLTT